jgi:hypothetical protein
MKMKEKMRNVIVEYVDRKGTATSTTRRMQWGPNVGYYIWWKNRMVKVRADAQTVVCV